MIVITGGAGFIGSNLASELNKDFELLIVDELDKQTDKLTNISQIQYMDCVDKIPFLASLTNNGKQYSKSIEMIFHLGACSKTTEKDRNYVMETNFEYSKKILHFCVNNNIPLIYASSASVYGSGQVFKEDPSNESSLNYYAESKLLFDNYYRDNITKIKSQVSGLRYFNVYGPRESHKQGMFSVMYNFFSQLNKSNQIQLFKGSHGYDDGEQRRDFIHVDDTVKVKKWLMQNKVSGIFNVGTGKCRSFNDVANIVISVLKRGHVEYIDFPDGLEEQYQAFTEADMEKLLKSGYNHGFLSLEEGVEKYIRWLESNK